MIIARKRLAYVSRGVGVQALTFINQQEVVENFCRDALKSVTDFLA